MQKTFILNKSWYSFYIFFTGLVFLSSCQTEEIQPPDQQIRILHEWLDSSRQNPVAAIVERLIPEEAVILVEDNILRLDTIALVKALIPSLHNLGIVNIGMYQYNSSKQPELNVFHSSSLAVSQLQEYRDFLHYIENFNAHLPPEKAPIELIALGEKNGIALAETRRLLDEGLSFLWLRSGDLELIEEAEAQNDPQQLEASPKTEPLIITHFGPTMTGLRWDGVVELVKRQRATRDRTFSFDPKQIPFSFWGYQNTVTPDIVIVTAFLYKSVNVAPSVIPQTAVMDALQLFPEVQVRNPQDLSAPRMDRIIRRQVRRYRRWLKGLQR